MKNSEILLGFHLYYVFCFQEGQNSVNVCFCENGYKYLFSVKYFLNDLLTFS